MSTGLLSIVAGGIPYSPRLELQDWIEKGREGLRGRVTRIYYGSG